MKLFKALVSALSLAAVFVLVAPKLKADQLNEKTIVTFNEPVEVPGVGVHVLPPGTYMFKLMSSSSDRHIVQIFSADGSHLYTTILAISNSRLTATDQTVMTFRERPAGQPVALKAWFYPGDTTGQSFVYEKSRAMELAQAENEPVPATTVEYDTADADALNTAPVETVTPTVQTAEVVQPAPPADVVAPQSEVAPASLPKTASQLPLITLLGFLMLGTGFAIPVLAKRTI